MKNLLSVLISVLSTFISYSQISPQQLTGLQLWLRADTAVILNVNNVTQWNDCSGNNYNAMQAGMQKAPVFIDSVICLNSKPVIRFDGLDDVLNGTTIPGLDNSSLSFFAVVNGYTQSSTSNNRAMIFGVNNTDGLWVYRNIYPAQERFEIMNYNLTGCSSNLSAPDNGFNYKTINYSKEINIYHELYINSQYVYFSGTPSAFINGDYYIGSNSFPAQTTLNGDIAEIILYNRVLTGTERQQILNYLDDKYGAEVDLGPDIFSTNFCSDTLDAGPCFTHYQWSTGDTIQTIIVNTGGLYSVTVTDIFGFTSSDTVIVHKPIVTTYSDTLCLGDSTTIHAGLSAPYICLWEWNGDSVYSEDYVIHAADTVILHIYDTSGCSVSYQIFMYTDSFPLTNLLCAPTLSICSGDTVFSCTDMSQITSYNWFDGTSNYSTPYFIVPVSWLGTGSHNLWLTCTNTLGCTATDVVAVSAPGQIPVTAFSATAGCEPFMNSYTDLSTVQGTGAFINDWIWNFNDGDSAFVQNPTHFFNDPGIHLVTLTVTTNLGCSMTVTDTVLVYSSPEPAFSPLLGCSGIPLQFTDHTTNLLGDINSWTWDFNDPYSTNNTSTLQSPSHTYDSAGYYWVQLTAISEYGCMATDSAYIHIRPSPQVDFSYTEVCDGSPVFFTNETFDSLGIYQMYWNIDGNIFTTYNPVYTFNWAGIFPVTLHVQSINGCSADYTENVEVFPLPVANFIVTPVCVMIPYTFYDSSYTVAGDTISLWEWDFGDGTSHSTVQNPSHIYANTGTYIVQLTVQTIHGCQDAITYVVSVVNNPPAPVITQVGNTLYSNSGIGNQWYNEYGIIPGATGQSYTPTDTGYYFVIVAYSAGCISDTSNIIHCTFIGINDAIASSEIMIYPNPSNGKFIIEFDNIKGKMENGIIEIYNVFGERVFLSSISFPKSEINLNLSGGIYFYQVRNEKQLIGNGKFIIQR